MPTELVDLLPEWRRRTLRRDYFFRLGTVALLLATFLVASAAALLLPTYVYLTAAEHTKVAHLASIEQGLTSADEAALSARLVALSSNATILTALGAGGSASLVVRFALAVARPGITLSSLSYTPHTAKTPGTLLIGGTALTRDALRKYQIALQNTSFASSVDLPVSAYAKDTDIAFAVTLTLAP